MGRKKWFYTIYTVLLVAITSAIEHRGQVFMIRRPEPIAVPIGDEVTLDCEMNIKPDHFRWRHFPIRTKFTKETINFGTAFSVDIPHSQYTVSGKQSTLTINVSNSAVAGDYQCLASYGASILASIPGRISIAEIGHVTSNHSKHFISAGNTVAIRCDVPPSNPTASTQYYKSNVALDPSLMLPTGTLLLQNVNNSDSGTYTCTTENYLTGEKRISKQKVVLVVTRGAEPSQSPKFLSKPPENYTVIAGDTVFMECSAIGTPAPTVTWTKLNGIITPDRSSLLPGGLRITNIVSSDQGVYVCTHSSEGQSRHLKFEISLLFYEQPTVESPQPIDVKEGEDLTVECRVKGTPEPITSWLLNGQNIINDTHIEAIGNKIYFGSIQKRHAGILQCFASNIVGTDFGYTFLKVFPKQISSMYIPDEPSTPMPITNTRPMKKKKDRKKKKGKGNAVMVPPSKPNVTRISDESVMVRWSVPENDGLPIQFFKVQYRELGMASQQNNGTHIRGKSSKWRTANADIIPHLRSYQVDNLKPDHIYRFRIAAVYSNNDNKEGPNSAKFHLKKDDFFMKNPLPAPRLTHTEPVSSTAIKIYWEYTPSNTTIDGFYVNYQPASSAGDYFKATVDGEQTRSYTIDYLQPDTSYDIKLQSYTTSSVSDFSAILKQKTLRAAPEATTIVTNVAPTTNSEISEKSLQLYIIIGACCVGVLLVIGVVLALIICKRKKDKRALEGGDGGVKSSTNEDGTHHIQVDSNGYISKSVPHSLTNGTLTNRMTITPNPLADADDNQNQNMIEMSCLSTQNNNYSSSEPSASNEESQQIPVKLKKKEIRSKLKTEAAAGANYL